MARAPLVKLVSGYSMPQYGFGCFAFAEMMASGDVTQCAQFADDFKKGVTAAVDCGYRHFDTAMMYKNEKEVGEALNQAIKDGKVKREDLFVTSKLAPFAHKYENAKKAIDAIVKNLNLGYVDLVLIHSPLGMDFEGDNVLDASIANMMTAKPNMIDYLEPWKALEEAVAAGTVRSIGVSNFGSKQVQRIIDNGKVKPVCDQVECHPYFPQTKLKAFLKERGMQLVAWSPLQNPSMNNFKLGNLFEDPAIANAAKAHNKSPAQVVLRWHVQRGNVPIPKSGNPVRIKQNIDIFDFQLTPAEMTAIDGLDKGQEGRLIKHEEAKDHPNYPYQDEF